jgi:hypothetical protein
VSSGATPADAYRAIDAQELAGYVLGFRSSPTSPQKVAKEDALRKWWRTFISSKRGIYALKRFEAARAKPSQRSQESANHDLSTLLGRCTLQYPHHSLEISLP